MTDKELIKQEIEKRFNDNMKASEQYAENSKSRAFFTSAAKEDYDLLAFIESFSEEPASEDFEENSNRFGIASTAAFIEKVINFLSYKLDDIVAIRVSGTIIPHHIAKQELIEDLKNYMKGE